MGLGQPGTTRIEPGYNKSEDLLIDTQLAILVTVCSQGTRRMFPQHLCALCLHFLLPFNSFLTSHNTLFQAVLKHTIYYQWHTHVVLLWSQLVPQLRRVPAVLL